MKGRPTRARGRAACATLACAMLAALTAAALAGCGSDHGGTPSVPPAGTSATPAPAAVRGPGERLPAAARAALRDYFAAVAAQDAGAARSLLAPGSALRDDPLMGIRALRDVRIDATCFATPPPGTSAIVLVSAYLAARGETAWGPPGRHDFFMVLTESPARTWLVDGMATSP